MRKDTLNELDIFPWPKWFDRWHVHAMLFFVYVAVSKAVGLWPFPDEVFLKIVLLMLLLQIWKSCRQKEKLI